MSNMDSGTAFIHLVKLIKEWDEFRGRVTVLEAQIAGALEMIDAADYIAVEDSKWWDELTAQLGRVNEVQP